MKRASQLCRRASGTAVCALAILASLASAPALGVPGAGTRGGPAGNGHPIFARMACITRLPVIATVPSPFAAAYRRVLPITMTSHAAAIRHLRVSLYTFDGDLLGRSIRRSLLHSAVVRVKLRYGLQPGAYTLYAEGEPNADPSCGPKHSSRVLRFKACAASLPVLFGQPPGGSAADYEGFVSFTLGSRGALIRALNVSLTNFAGELFGSTRLPVLFGAVTVNIPLTRQLVPGGYTITVSGSIPSQPPACEGPSAEQVLTFT